MILLESQICIFFSNSHLSFHPSLPSIPLFQPEAIQYAGWDYLSFIVFFFFPLGFRLSNQSQRRIKLIFQYPLNSGFLPFASDGRIWEGGILFSFSSMSHKEAFVSCVLNSFSSSCDLCSWSPLEPRVHVPAWVIMRMPSQLNFHLVKRSRT